MLANRVREFSNTIGTGDVTLGGAMAGHIRFGAAFAPGDSVIYVIENGDDYEIGTGTLVDANTLSRNSISETLVGGVLTTIAATPIPLTGQARIYCAATAEFLLKTDLNASVIQETTIGSGIDVEGVLRVADGAVFGGDVRVDTAVGIGTDPVSRALEVTEAGGATTVASFLNTGSLSSQIAFKGSSGVNDFDVRAGVIDANVFGVFTNNTEALRIDSSQKATFAGDITVGGEAIGNGATNFRAWTNSGNTGTVAEYAFTTSTDKTFTNASLSAERLDAAARTKLALNVYDGAALATVLEATSTLFDVKTAMQVGGDVEIAKTNANLLLNGTGITKAGIQIQTNSTLRWDINAPSGSADLVFDNGVVEALRLAATTGNATFAGTLGIAGGDVSLYPFNDAVIGGLDSVVGFTLATTGAAQQATISFADGTATAAERNAGFIQYQHNTDTMTLGTANAIRWAVNASLFDVNTDMQVGGDVTAHNLKIDSFGVGSVSATGTAVYGGGTNAGTYGANIQMYAESHVSSAYDMSFRAGSTSWLYWDNSLSAATLAGDLTVNDSIGVGVTTNIDTRVNALASTVDNFSRVFRALKSDSTLATSLTPRGLRSESTDILFYVGGTTETHRFDTTGGATFAGDVTANRFYANFGGTSASPSIQLDTDGTGAAVGFYGSGAAGTEFLGVTVAGVETLRIDSSQNASFAGSMTVGSGSSALVQSATSLTLDGASHHYLTFANTATTESGLLFAEPTDNDAAYLVYDRASATMRLGAGASEVLRATSSLLDVKTDIRIATGVGIDNSFVLRRGATDVFTLDGLFDGATLNAHQVIRLATGGTTALTLDSNQNASFAGNIEALSVELGNNLPVTNTHGMWLTGGNRVNLAIGGDGPSGTTLTNLTTKVGRIATPHYTNAEEPMAIALSNTTATDNILNLGGGSTLMNIATQINFHTAGNPTTVGSSIAMTLDNNQNASFAGQVTIERSIATMLSFDRTVDANVDNIFNVFISHDGSPATDFMSFGVGSNALRVYSNNTVSAQADLEVLGNILAGGDILGDSSTGAIVYGSSSTGPTSGANIAVFAENHATNAQLIAFRHDAAEYARFSGGNLFTVNTAMEVGGDVNISAASVETRLIINNTGTGDSALRFRLGGLTKAVMGVDRSDGNKFKIAPANIGTSDWLIIDPADNSALFAGNGTFTGDILAPVIRQASSTGTLKLSSDTSTASGAGVTFYGSLNALRANDIVFTVGASEVLAHDFSVGRWDFQGNDLVGVGDISRGSTSSTLIVSGGSASELGANLLMRGELEPSNANDIAFRVGTTFKLNYDDSASTWNFQGNALLDVGSVTMSGTQIFRDVSNSSISLSGGGGAGGSNIVLYGSLHATNAEDFFVKTSTATALHYDNSASAWNFQGNALVGVGDVTMSGDDIVRNVTSGRLVVSGGSTSGTGGRIRLQGEAATNAYDIEFLGSAGVVAAWDDSVSGWNFQGNNINNAGNLQLSGSDILRSSNAGTLFLSGGNTSRGGGYVGLRGPTHATGANDIILGAAGVATLQWDDSAGAWDFQGNSVVGIGSLNGDNDATSLNVSGGTSVAPGGNITLFGGSHLTQAGDISLSSGGATTLHYDASASVWDFQGNNVTDVGKLNLGSPTELTIATGAITITKSFHTIDTEANAAADDLITISSGAVGDRLLLKSVANARVVTVKNTGNIRLEGGVDFVMSTNEDTIELHFHAGVWCELSRSHNA